MQFTHSIIISTFKIVVLEKNETFTLSYPQNKLIDKNGNVSVS